MNTAHVIALMLVVAAAPEVGCGGRQNVPPSNSTAPLESGQPTGRAELQKRSYTIAVPAGAVLVGTAAVTEIRAFPEEVRSTAASPQMVEAAAGAEGFDRMYESALSYPATVTFFDDTFKREGFTCSDRTVTPTATVWSVKGSDNQPARVAVRNTNPATIEIVAVTADGATPSAAAPGTKAEPIRPRTTL
jgi:hypothetical protein